MGRSLRVLLVGILFGVIAAPSAFAQEYEGSTGDLTGLGGVYTPGDTIEITGGGFLANSQVSVTLMSNTTGNALDLTSVTSDGSGTLSATATMPSNLAAGAYTLSAFGVTPDGAVRTLSGEIEVAVEEVSEELTTTTPAPTTGATAETTEPATTTTSGESEAPEALPFEAGGDSGGSSTGLFIAGALILFALGGVAWWWFGEAVH